jgi:molybdopterin-guanine dinucleotide biosynthesis protein A
MNSQRETRTVIILCGGKSSRMGFPKWQLPFGDETMLQRILRISDEVAETGIVVAAAGQTVSDVRSNVRFVSDEQADRGPLQGIHAGLKALPKHIAAAFITSCDVPLLRPEFMLKLFDRLGKHDVVVPYEEEFHHPLAAVYRPTVLPVVADLLDRDLRRPVFLFDRVDTLRVDVAELRDVDPELESLRNLNDVQSYLDALRQAGFDRSAIPDEVWNQLHR